MIVILMGGPLDGEVREYRGKTFAPNQAYNVDWGPVRGKFKQIEGGALTGCHAPFANGSSTGRTDNYICVDIVPRGTLEKTEARFYWRGKTHKSQ